LGQGCRHGFGLEMKRVNGTLAGRRGGQKIRQITGRSTHTTTPRCVSVPPPRPARPSSGNQNVRWAGRSFSRPRIKGLFALRQKGGKTPRDDRGGPTGPGENTPLGKKLFFPGFTCPTKNSFRIAAWALKKKMYHTVEKWGGTRGAADPGQCFTPIETWGGGERRLSVRRRTAGIRTRTQGKKKPPLMWGRVFERGRGWSPAGRANRGGETLRCTSAPPFVT